MCSSGKQRVPEGKVMKNIYDEEIKALQEKGSITNDEIPKFNKIKSGPYKARKKAQSGH